MNFVTRLVIRLVGLHALSCFIATVGILWSKADLNDLLVDSGIYAGATVEQMLSGKQFNRGVRDFVSFMRH